MSGTLFLIALTGVIAPVPSLNHEHSEPGRSADAQVLIRINPEARVSAAVSAPMPPPSRCGEAIELKVQIDNLGFVTAPLRAAIVGPSGSTVALHMNADKLTGMRNDERFLHLIPRDLKTTDVTVAFSIDNNVGDLGERDRVHLLLRCI